jgi:hypothetical protein
MLLFCSRRSRATSAASSRTRYTSSPGTASRPFSAATTKSGVTAKHGFAIRPNSAIIPAASTRGVAGAFDKNRPHTTLAIAKQPHHESAAPVVIDSSDGSVYSDEDVDEYSDVGGEDVEAMLGISDAVLDDDVRDVVIRMNEQKQYVQACRRTAVNNVLDTRPPSGKRSQQRGDATTTEQKSRKEGNHFDWETSDEALSHLEDKLRHFYDNNESDAIDGRRKTPVVQQMRRFSVKVCQEKEQTVDVEG